MAGVILQTRITAILDGLTKAAVAEIEQLIEDDSAVFNREIQRREEEIETLKKRLHITEKELKKVQTIMLATADRCSVGVQVKMVDTDLMGRGKVPLPVNPVQTFNTRLTPELKEEKTMSRSHNVTDVTNALHAHAPEPRRQRAQHDEDEFNNLEFEMKIEQVEELVDQELNLPSADYSMTDLNLGSERKTAQRDHQPWSSLENVTNEFAVPDGCIGLEHYEQIPTDQCMASTLNCHSDSITNKLVDPFGTAHISMDRDMHFDSSITKLPEYGQLRDSVGHMSTQRPPNTKQRQTFGTVPRPHTQLSASPFRLPGMLPMRENALASHVGSKPFRCEECGKRFTQRTRLITHKRIHTGEKPYHCQLCGKMFSRQDNCLRHVRLHSGQRS